MLKGHLIKTTAPLGLRNATANPHKFTQPAAWQYHPVFLCLVTVFLGYNQYPIAPSPATANSKRQNVPILCGTDRKSFSKRKKHNVHLLQLETDGQTAFIFHGHHPFDANLWKEHFLLDIKGIRRPERRNDFVDHLTTECYLHLK